MSVIFKTLKKLKTEPAVKENSKNKLVHRKRIHFFKKALYSPGYVLLLLLILTVVGAGTLYGYYHFRETGSENIKEFTVLNMDIQKLKDVDTAENPEDNETISKKEQKDSGSIRTVYVPPRANDNSYTSNKPDDTEPPFITTKKPLGKPRKTVKRDAVTEKVKRPAEPKDKEVSAIPEMQKIFLANAKKNAKIARLVGDIRWEIEHGEDKRTEKLFDELADLKGRDNDYVLKLKAVWHMHNKEFSRAENLLKKVLIKNEVDQEAGINMAVIEINTKKIENAYQRLEKLQTLYPENIRIAEIMQDLKRLFSNAQKYRLSRGK